MAAVDTNVTILQHFINGERVAGESNRFGDVYNPATGQVQARVPFATAGEVDTAVQAASNMPKPLSFTAVFGSEASAAIPSRHTASPSALWSYGLPAWSITTGTCG